MNSSFSLLSRFPIRKTKEQKQAFLDAVQSELHRQGYACKVENGRFGCRNLVAGDPESARYLVTAHYDTCARLPFPNLCTPCNPVLFYGIQLIFIVFLAACLASSGLFTTCERPPLICEPGRRWLSP